MNNSYITIIKEKRTVLSRKRVPLNQNECTADFRIGVPFEQNLQHIFLSFIDIIAYNDTIVNFQSFHTKSSSSTHHLIFGKKKSTYPSRMNGAISSIVYCPGFFQVTFYPVSASFCTQIKHIRSTIFIQIASSVLFQAYSFGALRINSIENRFHYRNPIVEVNVPCVKIH